jgi:hypothetical protein
MMLIGITQETPNMLKNQVPKINGIYRMDEKVINGFHILFA